MLRAIVRKHPHSSLDELTHELRRRTGIKVNTVAMRKALSAAGIVRLKPQRRMGERTAAQGAAARYGYTARHRRPDNPNGMNTEVTDEVMKGATYLRGIQETLYGTGKMIITCGPKDKAEGAVMTFVYTAGNKSAMIAEGG